MFMHLYTIYVYICNNKTSTYVHRAKLSSLKTLWHNLSIKYRTPINMSAHVVQCILENWCTQYQRPIRSNYSIYWLNILLYSFVYCKTGDGKRDTISECAQKNWIVLEDSQVCPLKSVSPEMNTSDLWLRVMHYHTSYHCNHHRMAILSHWEFPVRLGSV